MAEPKGRTITLSDLASTTSARAVGLLAIVHPPELARRIDVSKQGVVLGRESPDAAGVIEHGTVSRRHVQIAWDGRMKAHVVSDLESHNGSWLDGERLGSARSPLHDQAVLRIGGVVLVYESAALDSGDDDTLAQVIVGDSAVMRRLRVQIARAAVDPSPCLITGPTGAGKEHVARALHRLSGRSGPWVAMNVAELSKDLAESQLFGHVKGAFTGAEKPQPGLFRSADGGTLCLDEIGELPIDLQPKLLRVIQEREVRPVGGTRAEPFDVRIIAATNRDLGAEVEAGRFRRDLWARLTLWELSVPPLARRRADIPRWIERLHRRWCDERSRNDAPLSFTPDALEALLLADFPDNLRGLDRVVHRLAVDAEPVTRDRVAPLVGSPPVAESNVRRAPPQSGAELGEVLAREGSIVAAAKWYGCDRRQLYRWMDAFGLRKD